MSSQGEIMQRGY